MSIWPALSAATGLLVDLYHLDAAYVSWRTGHNAPATFDLYTRSAPFGGAYLLAAGLEPALAFVCDFRFTEDDLAYLARIKSYNPAFLDELRRFRFCGGILAMPEGTVAFADEPLLRVTAPFREALLLESGLLRAIGVSTLIATKAARLDVGNFAPSAHPSPPERSATPYLWYTPLTTGSAGSPRDSTPSSPLIAMPGNAEPY